MPTGQPAYQTGLETALLLHSSQADMNSRPVTSVVSKITSQVAADLPTCHLGPDLVHEHAAAHATQYRFQAPGSWPHYAVVTVQSSLSCAAVTSSTLLPRRCDLISEDFMLLTDEVASILG